MFAAVGKIFAKIWANPIARKILLLGLEKVGKRILKKLKKKKD